MARSARVVVPEYPYHITQRGNYRQMIFDNDRDRFKYLSWIDEYSKKYSLSLLAFCLMNNHVHFIVIPEQENSLSKLSSIVHMRYSQYFNRGKNISGHLWQGRFYSSLLGEDYLMGVLRYVEKNPVRAGIVKEASEWKWSSAAYHVGRSDGLIKLENIENIIGLTTEDWQKFLDTDERESEVGEIRKFTKLGRPLGTKTF
jgi:putative transposase